MTAVRILFFLLLVSDPLFAQDPVSDYAFAQKCYHSLDKTKTKTKGWNHCLNQFEKIVEKYPGTAHARKALFSLGRLSEEKYEITGDKKDLERVFQTYNAFLKAHPRDPLADDALYRIAKLRWEKQKDNEKAIRALETLIERYPEGDMSEAAARDLEKRKTGNVERETSNVERRQTEGDFTVRTVVIDPGHGGDDAGAKGKLGTKESEVALQVAKKLAGQLKKTGVNVFLTRTTQKGLSLHERNRFASAKKADLFISIHANANPSPKLSGVQTFYLNNATSEAAEELAKRENKVAGKTLSLPERILTTMRQNADTLESRDLAHAVHRSLVSRLQRDYSGVKDLRVETAIFQVLDGVQCPSILIETSFITNPTEEKRLKDSRYQWALAEGIAQGVQKYMTGRTALVKASSL